MSVVTPQGLPDPPLRRPGWPLVVAVGAAGAILGYVLGAVGPSAEPIAGEVEATTTTAEPTTTTDSATTTTVGSTSPTTHPQPPATLGDLVPGFEGMLVAEVGGAGAHDLVVWRDYMPAARTHGVDDSRMFAPDAEGRWVAALGRAAGDEWYSVLHLGRPGSLYPAVLDVSSFVWHTTEPGRISWIQRPGGSGDPELWIGELGESGGLVARERVTAGGAGSLGTLEAWDNTGFLVTGFDPTVDTQFSAVLDPAGVEHWRIHIDRPLYTTSKRATTLLMISHTGERFVSWLTTDPMVAPELIDWAPQAYLAAISTDGDRVAFFGDGLELWTTEGTFVSDLDLAYRVWWAEWSPDGRFVVAAGEGISGNIATGVQVVLFIDTQEHEIHAVVFRDWVQRVFVRP